MRLTHALICLLLGVASAAHAQRLDVRYKAQIKSACLNRVHTADAIRFCSCVGRMHFQSAQSMPTKAQALHDLRWALGYYRAHDARTLRELRADPDNLVAFDAMIGSACRSRR